MPLMLADTGNQVCIRKITGNDETRRFLNNLGFIAGENVMVISEIGGNIIVSIKGSRVALDKSMAGRIMI